MLMKSEVALLLVAALPLCAQDSWFQPSVLEKPDVRKALQSMDDRATEIGHSTRRAGSGPLLTRTVLGRWRSGSVTRMVAERFRDVPDITGGIQLTSASQPNRQDGRLFVNHAGHRLQAWECRRLRLEINSVS